MSDLDLHDMVNRAVGVPDGVINCSRLHQLLHLLVRTTNEIQQELVAAATDDEFNPLEDGCGSELDTQGFREQWHGVTGTVDEHTEKLQLFETELQLLTERLKKCCETLTEQDALSGEEGSDHQQNGGATTEDGLAIDDATSKQSKEQAVESISEIEELMRSGQDHMENKLKLLENQLAKMQKLLASVGLVSVDVSGADDEGGDLEAMEAVLPGRNLADLQNTHDLVLGISKELEQLKAQIAELNEQRSQMDDVIKQLLEEKDNLTTELTKLAEGKTEMDSLVDKLAQKVGLSGDGKQPPESAGTTHRMLTDLNCLACETDVVQRDRDDSRPAVRGKSRPRKSIRKAPREGSTVQSTLPTRMKRAAGGSHTIVKPIERVLRSTSTDLCRCSTSSSSPCEEKH
ncbi:uncharacterized protein LOC131438879 [Malaya genurostris]|uniref:uncharacterized protein LOC131438879 n=1 Tax=Malaya genurostris TaxID=325434 RepID=UPI0026F3D362|nr:uncharacterized protein LOC131438879 [Malaya genurostris]